LHEPPIIFLDEPTGGVDPVSRREFWRLIDHLSSQGRTILVTTHYLDEAERCDRIAIIHAGRLAAIGTTRSLKAVFADRPIIEVRTARPVEAMGVLDGMVEVEKTSLFGTAVHAVLSDAFASTDAIEQALTARGIGVLGIARVAPSLEDVFLDVVDRQQPRGVA
jgi:ABC-2 type transport system ATP-binding protein